MSENVPYAAVRETHIGVVFLVGDRAYKLKKPVDMGFLDFSTPDRRLAACRREVELNRRLAPDVYLGVAEVSDVDGAPGDHLVVMRRMPDDRRLSTLVASGAPLEAAITRLARQLASFHSTAERGPHVDAEGTRKALADRWEASFAQVESVAPNVLPAGVLAEIEALARDFLAGREPLFRSRIEEGRIVDGHGDLLADDVFVLDDGPRVLDCLEFDDRLRRLDGLDDVAFLAMDLERLGAAELGELLLDRYTEHTADPAPAALRAHYLAYRAFVRVKVACLRHAQGDDTAAAQARAYAGIAIRHLRAGQVRLVLVGGLPGSGKTTLAGLVADDLGAVLLSSDRLRKELAGIDPTARRRALPRRDLHTRAHGPHLPGTAAPGGRAAGPWRVGRAGRVVVSRPRPGARETGGGPDPQLPGRVALRGPGGGDRGPAAHQNRRAVRRRPGDRDGHGCRRGPVARRDHHPHSRHPGRGADLGTTRTATAWRRPGKGRPMHAKAGDWLIVEKASVDHEARRGRIEEVRSADGMPPYRVRWLDSGREALVFPGSDAHVVTQEELDAVRVFAPGRSALSGRESRR